MITFSKRLDVWKISLDSDKIANLSECIRNCLNLTDVPDHINEKIKNASKFVHMKLKKKFIESNRMYNRMNEEHREWLNKKISIDKSVTDFVDNIQSGPSRQTLVNVGRPLKPFTDLNEKYKKRKAKVLFENRTSDEIRYAASMLDEPQGNSSNQNFSLIETLAMYLDMKLSVSGYKTMCRKVNSKHPKTFPCYDHLLRFKKSLQVQSDVTETSAEINLQELLDCTSRSILQILSNNSYKNLTLLVKCGFDGSSGHSRYKQKFECSSTDEFMFFYKRKL